jgi:6-phospho-beta-glucosidase
MKVAVIGGGSTYTPELVSGFVEHARELDLQEVWLMDIDRARLDIVGGYAWRMVEAAGRPFVLNLTTSRADALRDAAFVETQIRVGGMRARLRDEELGARWSLVGQETTGVGGMAKALRTVPVILSVADDMRRLCPDAWLINFANPSGLVTEALQRYAPEVRSIGLCNSPIGTQMRIAKQHRVGPYEVILDYLGLNHLSWIRGARVNGRNVWPAFFKAYLEGLDSSPEAPCPPWLARALEAIPSSYLRYYYRTSAVVAAQSTRQPRAARVMQIEQQLLAQYANPDLTSLPPELLERGGAYYSTAAVNLMLALMRAESEVHVVNTRVRDAVPGWPADWVAEIPCRVSTAGVYPLPARPLPPLADGLVRTVKSYELLTAEAAVTGSIEAAHQALVAHPLGPGADRVPAFWDDLLLTHAQYLPAFGGRNAR